MDMFKKDSSSFYIEDFLENPHLAFNFFDILTNYSKCWDFLTKDYNNSPLCDTFSDWVTYATKMYKILTYGAEEEEGDG